MKKEVTEGSNWGGVREGAGRPKSSIIGSHVARPKMGKNKPAKVTLRVRSGFPSLKSHEFLSVFTKACLRSKRFGMRIIHFCILNKKIILLCEFKKQEDLEKSFKSLNTTIAIALKKIYLKEKSEKHKGPVMLGRFQIELLGTPAEVKNAMKEIYTLDSYESKQSFKAPVFSSAPLFHEWQNLLDSDYKSSFAPKDSEHIQKIKEITSLPQFWLLKSGWRS